MERMQLHLAMAGDAARHLGQLLRLQAQGLIVLGLPDARQLLAQALRHASDACEEVGVQQGDHRWTGPVALLHNAGAYVWTVRDPGTTSPLWSSGWARSW